MAKITVTATISDHLMPFLDSVRHNMTPEEFYRKALELGLNDLIETAARRSRDNLHQWFQDEDHDYQNVRAVLRVDAPPTEDSAPGPKAEITALRRGFNG